MQPKKLYKEGVKLACCYERSPTIIFIYLMYVADNACRLLPPLEYLQTISNMVMHAIV